MENCGIYKITSPSGRIYIGQAVDLKIRASQYKQLRCKRQPRVYNSIKKYGWKSHIFEIIHYCDENELDDIERYYQDLYEVIGEWGLNCQLTVCDGMNNRGISKEKSALMRENNAKSRRVIDTQTSIIYRSGREVSELPICNISYSNLRAKLKGTIANDTNFMYLEDYEKRGVQEPQVIESCNIEVRNTLTLKKYSSIKEAAKDLGVLHASLCKYLSGKTTNITYCVYEKDYIEGQIQHPKIISRAKRVIDTNTKIIYESAKDTAEKTGINLGTIKGYLKGNNQTKTAFRYYD